MSTWLRTIGSRCWAMLRRDRLDREFDEELTTHLELLVDEACRRGLSPADARHEARRKLGRPAALREAHREQQGMPRLEALGQDICHSFRLFSRTPIVTATALFTIALGVGASTAVFSLVDRYNEMRYIYRSWSDGSRLPRCPSCCHLPQAVFQILVALADQDRHGYAIMQDVAVRTDGALKLSPGRCTGRSSACSKMASSSKSTPGRVRTKTTSGAATIGSRSLDATSRRPRPIG